jgi:hypothetical protein
MLSCLQRSLRRRALWQGPSALSSASAARLYYSTKLYSVLDKLVAESRKARLCRVSGRDWHGAAGKAWFGAWRGEARPGVAGKGNGAGSSREGPAFFSAVAASA